MAPWKGFGLLGAATRTFADGFSTTTSERKSTTSGFGRILSGLLSRGYDVPPPFFITIFFDVI